jgi:outer membrane protein assembly factor BamB
MRLGVLRWIVLVAVSMVLLSACDWSMFGYAPNGSRSSPDATINTANVANLALKLKLTPATVPNGCITDQASSPAVAGGSAYAEFSLTAANPFVAPCNADDEVAAFNAATGATLWTETAGTHGVYYCILCVAMPAVVNGIVYDSATDSHVYAFNATTGQPVWTATAGGNDATSPTVANWIVYIAAGSETGPLYALNATTGAVVWTAGAGGESSPTVANNIVYSGPSGGSLDAFNATTGAVVWTQTGLSGTSDGLTDASPAVVNGTVFACPNGSAPKGFNATTGALAWTAAAATLTSGPAVANGIFYTGGLYRGPLYAFNATTGATLWTATTDSIDTPAVANGIVYVGSYDGSSSTLNAFNATTGAALWSAPTGTFRTVNAYNPYNYSAPVVANGVVYIGSGDGNIYAFGLP